MGAAFLTGDVIVAIAVAHGWTAERGTKHPHLLKKPGKRPVPVRAKLQNRFEVQGILKQLDIPRDQWPAAVR